MKPIHEVERTKKVYKLTLDQIRDGELTDLINAISNEAKIEHFSWIDDKLTVKTFYKKDNSQGDNDE